MTTKRHCDWIVVGSGDLAGTCLRCGDKLMLPLPMNLSVWCAATKEFYKIHKRCKPKMKECDNIRYRIKHAVRD